MNFKAALTVEFGSAVDFHNMAVYFTVRKL